MRGGRERREEGTGSAVCGGACPRRAVVGWERGQSRNGTVPAGTCPRSVWLLLVAVLVACAGPKPILYPNEHYKHMGENAAQADIEDCRELAEKAGATPGTGKAGEVAKQTAISGGIGAAAGAVSGAIVGAAGTGSAIGAASGVVWGLLGSLFRSNEPSEAYKGYVTRCLREKGYDPTGWQ
jgi:hypothetical protein